MPTLFKMSDDKKIEDGPTVVFTEMSTAAPPRKMKKYVIIAVSGILAMGIILTAILVGMYMFTEAQKEIVQYTMQLNSNSKQDVTSDPNENVVQYHVSTPGQDSWIINDFNRDIQVVKIVGNGKTNCYVSPLNVSNAMDPSKINGPDTATPTSAVSLMYETADTPVTDSSFLGKTASAACQGISVYWLYPYCNSGNGNKPTNGTNMDQSRRKRQTYVNNAPYYCSSSDTNVACITGCCMTVCACSVQMSWTITDGQINCNFVVNGCDANQGYTVTSPCNGPSGLTCGATQDCNPNC